MPVYSSYLGEIASELDAYRKKGEKEAAHHRPASDSGHLDQNEAALQSMAEKYLASEQHFFDSALSDASHVAVECEQKTVELEGRVTQLLADTTMVASIEADMSGERDALVAATEARMKAEVDWKAHRAKNGITIQADYPDSRIWHLAVIASLALVETLINAFFYENAQGLLGGFTVALGVAIVNMGGALILGFGFRYKNLAKLDYRILGWACLVLFLLLSIYCNALFASFRAEYQLLADPTDPLQVRQGFSIAAAEAKKVFVLNMGIPDLTSFVLFGLGLVLSGFAFFKGYTLDDKYPGHGKLDRIVKEKRKIEVSQQELLRQKVKEILHRRKAEVQAAIHEPAQLINQAARRVSELHSAKSTLEKQSEAVQRDFAMVLNAYRHSNASIRATPPPEYFKSIPDLMGKVDSSSAEEAIKRLTDVQQQIADWREKNQSGLNAKLQSLHEDSAALLNQTFSAFLKEIEQEAHENINRAVATIHRVGMEVTNA